LFVADPKQNFGSPLIDATGLVVRGCGSRPPVAGPPDEALACEAVVWPVCGEQCLRWELDGGGGRQWRALRAC